MLLKCEHLIRIKTLILFHENTAIKYNFFFIENKNLSCYDNERLLLIMGAMEEVEQTKLFVANMTIRQ